MNFHPTDVSPHPGPHAPRAGTRQQAFTLIELLIVIAVLGVLMTLATLAWKEAKVRAYDTQALVCARNIKTAEAIYLNDNHTYTTYENLSGQDLSGCSVVYRQAQIRTSQILAELPASLLPALRQTADMLQSVAMAEAEGTRTQTADAPPIGPVGNGNDRSFAYRVKHASGRTTFVVSEEFLGPVSQAPASVVAFANTGTGAANPITADTGSTGNTGNTGSTGSTGTPPAGTGHLQLTLSQGARTRAYFPAGSFFTVTNDSGTTVATVSLPGGAMLGNNQNLPIGTYTLTYIGPQAYKLNTSENDGYGAPQWAALEVNVNVGQNPTTFTSSSVRAPNPPKSATFNLDAAGINLSINPNVNGGSNGYVNINIDAANTNVASVRVMMIHDTATPFKSTRACVGRCWEDGTWTIENDFRVSGTLTSYTRDSDSGDAVVLLTDFAPVNSNRAMKIGSTITPGSVILSPLKFIGVGSTNGFGYAARTEIALLGQGVFGNWYY